jgi:hypothetical protein
MKNKLYIFVTFATIAVGGFLLAAPWAQAGLFSKSETTETVAAKKDSTASKAASYRTPNFLRLDANKDDKLSKEEYLQDQLDAFIRRDENKDGFLSADENDFPSGISTDQKAQMRERMMEDEKRLKEMEAEMEKRRAEREKQREEENLKRQAEEKAKAEKEAAATATKSAKDAKAPAVATEPLKEEKPVEKSPASKAEKPASE